jgi:hypothetical protein
MQKWEYFVVWHDHYKGTITQRVEKEKGTGRLFSSVPEMLGTLGSEGWELVNSNFWRGTSYTHGVEYYFKRPIE